MYYYGSGYGHHMFFGPFEIVGHILFFALIIFGILWFLRMRGRRGGKWSWSSHSALTILNERYAKGEIDKAEYEERKKTLLS